MDSEEKLGKPGIRKYVVVETYADMRWKETLLLSPEQLAIYKQWRSPEKIYESYRNSSVQCNIDDMHLSGMVGDISETAAEFTQNHCKKLSVFNDERYPLFYVDGKNFLAVKYRTSAPFAESIATLELSYGDAQEQNPVFQTRFMEVQVNGIPSLVITAIQRYTDDDLSPMTKLKREYPDRFKAYQEESNLVDQIEKKLDASLSEVSVLVALSLAKASGDKQFMVVPYKYQLWRQNHERAGDKKIIPNVYDSLGQKFHMNQSAEVNDWWFIKDTTPITLDNTLGISASALAIAQNSFMLFLEKINTVKQPISSVDQSTLT